MPRDASRRSEDRIEAIGPNEVWAMDFVHDRQLGLDDGVCLSRNAMPLQITNNVGD